jgi:glycerophosphoryl diester phosphodiesterase
MTALRRRSRAVREPPAGDAPRPEARGTARPCLCIAHRGFSAAAPENTLAAVRKAVEAGADGCEFDVQLSRDGLPVLMHDATVDRTTNGKGKVGELLAAELQRLDAGSWKDPAFAGEPVPTLLDALRALAGAGRTAVIEVKDAAATAAVVEAVRQAGMVDASVVVSFHEEALADIRAREPRLRCGLLVGGLRSGSVARRAERLAEQARACGAAILDLRYPVLSAKLVAELHRSGFQVWGWTVNDAAVVAVLARWGVDAITTDHPDVMRGQKREGE